MRLRTVLALMPVALPAAAERIAALPPSVADAAPEIVDRLHDAVARGLAEGGEAVPAAEVRDRLAARPEWAGCRTVACLAGLAEALGAQRLAAPAIEITGKNYHMRIDLLGGGTGQVLASREASCDICTLAEAEAALHGAAADLAKTAPPWPPPPPPPPAAMAAPPAGAKLDVKKVRSPSRKTLYHHRHDLIALGAVLAGTAAVIGGGYLVARHGECSERDASNTCVELHNTGAAGAALVGGGVVAYGGAAIATWLGIRTSRRNVYVAPARGGGLAAASLEF